VIQGSLTNEVLIPQRESRWGIKIDKVPETLLYLKMIAVAHHVQTLRREPLRLHTVRIDNSVTTSCRLLGHPLVFSLIKSSLHIVGLLIVLLVTTSAINASNRAVNVFAAASLKPVLDQLANEFQRETSIEVSLTYAGSNVLARQIEEGAPADIFVSADLEWMDALSTQNLIVNESRFNFAGNRLVLIAPHESIITLSIAPHFPLADALGTERLAIADVRAVPAGRYAKAALISLGVWDQTADKIAQTENVRAALAFVARGECPLGIVYRTDALSEARVKIIAEFQPSLHPPIIYPAALITASNNTAASRFHEFLRSPSAEKAIEAFGFIKTE